ncbi:MAG: hypothetical protein EXX96DRAFT_571240 [Benjaminiella poitrasii]|nr:MAG: hypothetical protein EXX96DRAFT_571240 [Benjaminiella poitrasii]
MKYITFILAAIFIFITTTVKCKIADTKSASLSLRYSRQFLMDIYTLPNRKGLIQRINISNEEERSCWNLTSSMVGSVAVNNPFVKVTFYKSLDCRGFPIVNNSNMQQISPNILHQRKPIMKARSVSVTKTRKSLLLMDLDKFYA